MFSSQFVQWDLLAVWTARENSLFAFLCASLEGWFKMSRNLYVSLLSRFFFILSLESSGVHHLLECGQGLLKGTCVSIISCKMVVRESTLLVKSSLVVIGRAGDLVCSRSFRSVLKMSKSIL